MSKIIQIGSSLTADFQENTWTFEMEDDVRITAGRFVIVPLETFKEMSEALIQLKNWVVKLEDWKGIYPPVELAIEAIKKLQS